MPAAASPWKLGGLSVVELGKRVYREFDKDRILGHSAELAYYFMLALFPALLFLTALLGIFAGPGSEMRNSLMQYLSRALPSSASGLVQQTLDQVVQASGGGKLSFGIIAAWWSAAAGIVALSTTLNDVYDVEETRSFIKLRAVALALTVGLAVLIVSALVLVLYGGKIAEILGRSFHLGSAFTITWKIVQWPVVLVFLFVAFALIYYFAPNLKDQKWTWVSPGAVIGVLLWLAASFAFKIYLSYFNSYSATSGALGAVIILMLWLYVSGAAILLGGEINSEIENAAAHHGAPDAKAAGEKAPGERLPQSQRKSEKRPAA
jgi:membrane protein